MASKIDKPRVCVIGAGQAGMAALYYFAKLEYSSPEVTCYERGATWGGQWNITWRTDTYEHGERVHSGMYRTMWTNLPKECNELPHYTFKEHLGKNIPSFFPAAVMRHYLEGYWKSSQKDLTAMIRFNHAVTNVSYNADTDDFTVVTRDLVNKKTNPPETYSHVIVATGNYIYPHAPEFKGFDTFPGRIMHSQQFRGGQEFRGKRILVIGSSLSAEDVAAVSYKYGACHVIVTWKNHPLGYIFPEGVEERPLLQEVEGNIARFKDGSTAEIDIIVLCTGYNMSFPFLEDGLRLSEQLSAFFPDNLYKGVVWLEGGNNKLLYIGMQVQVVPMPLADAQAVWIVRYITGTNPINGQDKKPPGLNEHPATVSGYLATMKEVFSADNLTDKAAKHKATKAVLQDIVDDVCHPCNVDGMFEMLIKSSANRREKVLEFRNCQFTSLYTGITAAKPKVKWIDNFDDKIEDYVINDNDMEPLC